MMLTATAMSGCALKWWCWWSPRQPEVNWDTFTTAFLWRFKPEYRDILPIFDEEEESDPESPPLMEPNDSSQELLNDTLQAWDEFLLSTDPIEVPTVGAKNLMVETVTPASEFNGEIDITKLDGSSKIAGECQVRFHCAPKSETISENQLSGKRAVRMALLSLDAIDPLSGAFRKAITHFAEPSQLALLSVDLKGFKGVAIHLPDLLIPHSSSVFAPPLPKPPDLTYGAMANPPPPPEPPDLICCAVEYAAWMQRWVHSMRMVDIRTERATPNGIQPDPLPEQMGRNQPNSVMSWAAKKWDSIMFNNPQRCICFSSLALTFLHSLKVAAIMLATTTHGHRIEHSDVAETLGNRTGATHDQYHDKLYVLKGKMQYMTEEKGSRYFDVFGTIATVSCWHCHLVCKKGHFQPEAYDSEEVAHHFSAKPQVVTLILEVNFSLAFPVLSIRTLGFRKFLQLNAAEDSIGVAKWDSREMLFNLSNWVPLLQAIGVPIYYTIQGKLGGVLIHGKVHTPGFITCVDEQMTLHDFYSKIGNMRTAQQVCDERAHMIVVSSESPFCGYITADIIDGKELLSYEFVSKCCAVVVMQFVYGDFGLLRLISGCGCVPCVLMFKKRDITHSFLANYYLKEEPYTAEKIKDVYAEKLTAFLHINAFYLNDVIMYLLSIIDYLWRAKQPHNVSVAAEVSSCALQNPIYLENVKDVSKVFDEVDTAAILVGQQGVDDSIDKIMERMAGTLMTNEKSNNLVAAMGEHIFTASHTMYYKSDFRLSDCNNGTMTSPSYYCALIGDTIIKTYDFKSAFSNFSFGLVAGSYITWTTGYNGSKSIIIQISWDKSIDKALQVGAGLGGIEALQLLSVVAEFDFANQDAHGFSAAMHDTVTGQAKSFWLLEYAAADVQWDPGGDGYFFLIMGSSQFQQWDPGGCYLVYGEGPFDLETTWIDAAIPQQHCSNFNLEDKVAFNGGGNVMILIEEATSTNEDGKVVIKIGHVDTRVAMEVAKWLYNRMKERGRGVLYDEF